MKRFTLRRELLLLVCGAMLFTACQKETTDEGPDAGQNGIGKKLSGVVEDDNEFLVKTPLIISTEFKYSGLFSAPSKGGGKRTKDSDGDGIPDSTDGCPLEKETVNGYQDSDGCPDTVPPPPPDIIDTDNDGIPDASDACPTQAETYNGYNDADGCPDTVPAPLPPAPSLPSRVVLSTPPVGDQGNEFSCVPFAVVYGARSIEQFYKSGAGSFNFSTNIFSPEFVYNQTKFGSCSAGTAVGTVLDFLTNTGSPTWTIMPYSGENGCTLMPTSSQTSEAAKYKISSSSKIISADRVAIKTMLSQNHPLVVNCALEQSFYDAKPGFIWKSYTTSPGLAHALTIVGYDDSKNAYLVMNSWGTDWADAGFTWIDYDFFPEAAAYYTYAITL